MPITPTVSLLVVDDEVLLQHLMCSALEDGGYSVLSAGSAAEAFEILEREGADLAALVTDINLGAGPKGWEVAHRARRKNRSVAVVYVTGDSADDWPVEGVPASVVIQKPFAVTEVVVAVAALRANVRGGLPGA